MMAQGVAVLPQNGFPLADALRLTSEIQQYEKILKLRDEIVAGTHPRIKLNTFVPFGANLNQVVGSNGSHTNDTAKQNLPAQSGIPGLQSSSTAVHDPDTSLRSKARLERQRIERDIAESLKKERETAGHRGYDQDVLPNFDVSEVFFQAQEISKPLSLQADRQTPNSASADEETFYSSAAGTEESEEQNGKKAASKPCKFFFEDGTCKKGDRCNFSHDLAFKRQLQKTSAANNRSPPRPGFTAQGGRIRESPTYGAAEDGEVADEAPYSPTMHIAVEDLPLPPNNNQFTYPQAGFNQTPPNPSRTDSRPQGHHQQRGKDTQVVRKHIMSPIAPQPSRVSPLVVTKVSHLEKRRNENNRGGNQHHDAASQQGPRSKKRRRDADTNDYARNVAQRITMASPEPYIKPEPVSPPPLSMIPAPSRRPSGFTENSPRYNDRSFHDSFADTSSGRASPRVISTPPGHRRVISGPGPTSDTRRQQDLRRIVSVRNFERPPSPGTEARQRARERSLQRMDYEPVSSESYQRSNQPKHQVYLVDDYPTSPVVRYTKRVQEPELIPLPPPPPPSGRVVVDEYGNRYLETTMPDRQDINPPQPRYVDDVQRRPVTYDTIRASVQPEPRYYEQRTYRTEPQPSARASVRPEPQYLNERPRQSEALPPRASMRPEPQYMENRSNRNEPLPRASVQPESRYYEERRPQVDSTTAPRASIRPEARAEAVFINPTFEQFNMSARPGESYTRPQIESDDRQRFHTAQPRNQQDPRGSVQPISRPIYVPEASYQISQDYQQPLDTRAIVRRADDYGRMAQNVGRMSVMPVEHNSRASVRPMEYDDGGYRQSVAPERYRYQETRREPTVYTTVRQDAVPRQEFIDPVPATRPAYRYVSTARDLGPGGR